MPKWSPLLDWPGIQERLENIFPSGITNRNYVVRDIAAKTVYVMLYVGAIEDYDVWIRPNQVTRMNDAQAAATDPKSRRAWLRESMKPDRGNIQGRWYQQDTREPIRDETLRLGLVELGAVVVRPGLAPTSAKPRYALQAGFAALFDPALEDTELDKAIQRWQDTNLSRAALARIALLRDSTVETGQGLIAHFPNGETRRLAPGPSSIIAKAVVEVFAPRFLKAPGVVWLSESTIKEDRRDQALTQKLGLKIKAEEYLPDIILVDLGPVQPLFVFVEVVATDGPITEERRKALLKLILDADYQESHAAFITAYQDRETSAFRKTFPTLAWRSFAWCVSEPDRIIGLHAPDDTFRLSDLLIRL